MTHAIVVEARPLIDVDRFRSGEIAFAGGHQQQQQLCNSIFTYVLPYIDCL